MGETAEVLVRDFGITRREQDEFALVSHQRWTAANEAGKFRNEIVPFYVPPKFEAVEEDIGPRKNQTLEALAKLPPYFDKRTGTVTAGNSSPITDGAAAALIMSADRAKTLGFKPLGTIKAVAFAGFDPSRMGISPLFATHKALKTGRHEDEGHRADRAERGLCRPDHCRGAGRGLERISSRNTFPARSPSASSGATS